MDSKQLSPCNAPSVSEHPGRLKFTHSFVFAARHLLQQCEDKNISAAKWADYQHGAGCTFHQTPRYYLGLLAACGPHPTKESMGEIQSFTNRRRAIPLNDA